MKNQRRPRREGAGKPFRCGNCSRQIETAAPGTANRNHCPYCLWSLHVDLAPGDRRSPCHGTMEPVAIWVKRNSEWALIHRCQRCGELRSNRVAGDDSPIVLVSLAMRPIVLPAFPLPLEEGLS